MDDDGNPDLLSQAQEGISVLVNDGTWDLGGAARYLVGKSPSAIAVSDLDGNASPDLAVAWGHIYVILNGTRPPVAADCNSNGTPDSCDIAAGTSRDDDRNGIPDACEARSFRRGDVDGSGAIDLSDAVSTLAHLFLGGPSPACRKAADADDSGALDLSDAIRALEYLYLGGSPPPSPFPGCGVDTTEDALTCAADVCG
jgi:hypothetical protein